MIYRSGIFLLLLLILSNPVHAQDDKQWLYDQINGLRAGLGLNGLSWNGSLNAAAQAHSDWMASTGIIAHEEDNGSTPSSRALGAGYGGKWVSENIYGAIRAGASTAFNWWLNSSIHYAALTHVAKTEIGIGISQADGMSYFVVLVGEGGGGGIPYEPPEIIELPPINEEPVEAAAVVEAPIDLAAVAQEVGVVAEEPTAVPRPLITFTPSPTIPTYTPTITWTPTFTWTPSPTATEPPATSTPIHLATALPLEAQLALTPSQTPLVVALSPLVDTYTPIQPTQVVVKAEKKGFNWRNLGLGVLIFVQIMGLGWVFWRLVKGFIR